MPLHENTARFLELVGFTPSVATERSDGWNAQDDSGPYDLCSWATTQVRCQQPKGATPPKMMEVIGLTNEFQQSLLDPRFENVRNMEKLTVRIRDVVKRDYQALVGLIERHAVGDVGPTLDEPAEKVPIHPSDFPSALPVPPGPVQLYQAVYAKPLYSFLDEDGSVHLCTLQEDRRGGGDFAPNTHEASYWFPERVKCLNFLSASCKWADTWLVRIRVPKTWLRDLNTKHLWYGDEWKEHVWLFRQQSQFRNTMYENKGLLGGGELVKGHVSTGLSESLMSCKRTEVIEEMDEENVLKGEGIDGQVVQWAFMNSVLYDANAKGKIKVHIEVMPSRMARACVAASNNMP